MEVVILKEFYYSIIYRMNDEAVKFGNKGR